MANLPVYARSRRTMTSRRTTRRGRGGVAGQRRLSLWTRTVPLSAGPNIAGSIVGFNLLPDSNLDAGARAGSTVVRTRLKIYFAIDSAVFTVNPVDCSYFFGLMILPADIPAVDLPSPRNMAHYDWFGWEVFYPLAGGGVPSTGLILRTIEMDVKSSRRLLEQKDTVWLIVTGTKDFGAMQVTSSVLTKLH